MSSWYTQCDNNDVIITSRIRLARNLSGVPFGSRLTAEQKKQINERVREAICDSNTPYAKTLKYIDMNDVPENECYAMMERHIISPEFAQNKENKAILISDDESICVMIGEEDHIRIQVLHSGLDLHKAYDIAERIDTFLGEKLNFAFSEKLGYLTECPTNLGTGLRASVMLHLPLLESTREISAIADSVSKIGFTVRGIYGESSESQASLYQLSNQITLGISEKDALKNLEAITTQIIDKELSLREAARGVAIEDKVCRAYGILKNARIISSKEMMNLVSMIKLGVGMGIINIDNTLPMRILIECQPNMLMRKYGSLDAHERDVKRAQTIRTLLE
ncbi:MAG: protein arginine kinase [Acutalibacteraceae bacterium]|nr:protein arginine kinase [Acutalibacteraceae bacterium]